ncbi:DEAD/DEAH box helicase [Arthrobacter sp. YD4]|uniref:DEAD/DEAH box helicase n=1 Tax=Arthrobacter sp. YD4 TaxID=3058043 RepID=UPI0025B3CD80|nr:DEAD/DEAH box helicase [Arthrobacter sp. YD4]MDN3937543.1 DEAD/DEAH box helicase [Arthrobacter sp. YD4]
MELTWTWSVPNGFALNEPVQFAADYRVAPQSLVKGQLYPYQTVGIERLLDLYEAGIGCLLADEMGLGKTLQIIGLLAHAVRSGPSLVVCPASTLANWKRELSVFAPHLDVHIHQGPRRFGGTSQLRPFDVVLTSYETMAQDVHFLKAAPWEVVAFDEAQFIKNPTADRTRSAHLLRAKAKVAITGTPIENSLRDMWSIVDLVVPNYLPQLEDFLVKYPDVSAAAKSLAGKVFPIVIRRRLADVAESLPERINTMVPIAMGAEQASSYDSILSSAQAALPKISALRVCAAAIDTDTKSTKHQFLHELTSEAFSNNKKVLVFASFSAVIDSLAETFKMHGTGLFIGTLDGRTPIQERQGIIDGFSAHDGPGVLILNPRAAGVGLNIQAANYVVHFTPEWNPAIVDQASARAHRRGQLQTVFIYNLYYEDTIEEVMINRLEYKRKLQEDGLSPLSDGPSNQEVSRILALSPNGVTHAPASL